MTTKLLKAILSIPKSVRGRHALRCVKVHESGMVVTTDAHRCYINRRPSVATQEDTTPYRVLPHDELLTAVKVAEATESEVDWDACPGMDAGEFGYPTMHRVFPTEYAGFWCADPQHLRDACDAAIKSGASRIGIAYTGDPVKPFSVYWAGRQDADGGFHTVLIMPMSPMDMAP